MNGVYLGCLPLEIRFGRQEFGKVLWIGGLDETMSERSVLLSVLALQCFAMHLKFSFRPGACGMRAPNGAC